jgi:hypothetical protein
MSTLELETDPTAVRAEVTAERLVVHLQDGRILSVPLAWYPRLQHATDSERQNWRLLGDGYAVEWPDLDEHIGVEGLVAGRKSGEAEKSFQRWLSSRRTPP